MAKRRSREQWEQDLRDAQKNLTWDDEHRALGAIIRNSPKDAMFRTWRDLASFVASALLIVGGTMLLILAWNWGTHAGQLPWSVAGCNPLIASVAIAGCFLLWIGARLFRKSIS